MSQLSHLIHEEEDPFGPGTDLIISLVAFLLLILTMAAIYYKNLEAESAAMRQANGELTTKVANKSAEIEKLKHKIADLYAKEPRQQEFPPTFNIEAAQGFEFESGKANLNAKLSFPKSGTSRLPRSMILPNREVKNYKTLKEYVDGELVAIIDKRIHDFGINTIVIIGHTDGQRLARKVSTVDDYAPKVMEMRVPPTSLTPASNVDLGMMRALAVVAELREQQRTGKHLVGIDPKKGFRAYSAGSFLTPNGEWAPPGIADDPHRRRIEVRFQKEPGSKAAPSEQSQ